jgi:uncharacterized protein YbaA (DUF1428 family)
MSKFTTTEIEQAIGSEVDSFVYRVPKKNHDATIQLNKQFGDIMRKYEVAHLIFQLNDTDAPMEGVTNIAKTVSATQDEEVWMEILFYRDRKHKDEVGAKMRNDETMGPLWQQAMDLVTPGTDFIMGQFSLIRV